MSETPSSDGGVEESVTLHVEAAPFPQKITKPCCGEEAARLILDERTAGTSCSDCGTRIDFVHNRQSESEDTTEQTKLVTDGGQNVSPEWACDDCGGDVRLTESVSSDAHATESYECVECGATGEVQFGPGPDHPTWYGSVVPNE